VLAKSQLKDTPMFNTMPTALAQFAAPAIRQGVQDAIRLGAACTVVYVGIGVLACLGYGVYVGSTRTYRGARTAYTWADSKLRRVTLALPATTSAANAAEVPA